MDSSTNIQQLANEARNHISEYCMTECNAYCCRKGYLILSSEEVDLLVGDKRSELEKNEFIKPQDDGLFSFSLSNDSGHCPQLNGSKCMIHKNSSRPSTCSSYPIFINEEKKEIRLSPRCFAVRDNKLYLYVKKFLELGFKLNEF